MNNKDVSKIVDGDHKSHDLFDNRLRISLPTRYVPMEDDRILAMYPNDDRPQLLWIDEENERIFTLSLLDRKLAVGEVKSAISAIRHMIGSLYPSSLLGSAETSNTEIGVCGWFVFSTMRTKSRWYNCMFTASLDSRMLLGTGGCDMDDDMGKQEIMSIMHTLTSLSRQMRWPSIWNKG